MIGLLIATHGRLAFELLDAAEHIVRKPGVMKALVLDWDQDSATCLEEMREAVAEVDQGDGVIIATDMLGGTPSNVAMTLLEPGRVEVVTGVNLPMVVKFSNLREEQTVEQAAQVLAVKGRWHITVAGEVLAGREGQP
ncbi:MAG: PTS fructose transporter subunit IIA [Acidobacteriota bacterium]|nr:PTS fructose transporter subunit IIA [Acidobacteriota bacterium]MDQ7086747.1 PTS fructose transporter subunit IIA [Acidobacteriota bacterium]